MFEYFLVLNVGGNTTTHQRKKMERRQVPLAQKLHNVESDGNANNSDHGPRHDGQQAPCIKAVAWNTWLGSKSGGTDHFLSERLEHLVEEIKLIAPDVCALFDVSAELLPSFKEALGSHFMISQTFTDDMSQQSGTLLLLSRATVVKHEAYFYDYEDGIDGNIVGTRCTWIPRGVQAAQKVHLSKQKCLGFTFDLLASRFNDAPENDHIRKSQCMTLHRVLASIQGPALVLGDFNVFTQQEPAEAILLGERFMNLSDAWMQMKCPPRVKSTFVSKKLALRTTRILWKHEHALQPRVLSLLGVSPFLVSPSTGEKVFTSSHRGVFAIARVSASCMRRIISSKSLVPQQQQQQQTNVLP